MQEILQQNFTIHPVGQGLFYSGVISIFKSNKFRFVFDCGSINKTNCSDEVAEFRTPDYLTDGKLDLLVISHFDNDHVSHIQQLLRGGIKIDKLVMPFISFEERLFLAIRFIEENRGYDADIDFTVSFMIDPLGTIRDNLEGSSIFLIDSGPVPPSPIDQESNDAELTIRESDKLGYDFDERAKEELTADERNQCSFGNHMFKKVRDNFPGKVLTSSGIKIMEFVFYRRYIGEDEKEFYSNVKKLFCVQYDIDNTLQNEALLGQVKDRIRSITSAKKISDIFQEAKQGLSISVKGRSIKNLNTTALSLLHRNSPPLFPNSNRGCEVRAEYFSKPDGSRHSFVAGDSLFYHPFYEDRYFWRLHGRSLANGKSVFPNVLLTSDSFLLYPEEVERFFFKYKKNWDDFWLAQIPHHGSENNADRNLLSRFIRGQYCFVNYGVNNRDKHPSEKLVNDIVATGLSSRYFSINEYGGLYFSYMLYE